MSEMIERVARTLFEDTDNDTLLLLFGRPRLTWEQVCKGTERGEIVGHALALFRHRARIAISAMRNPTEAMEDAGWNKLPDAANEPRLIAAYQAMIDEALKD